MKKKTIGTIFILIGAIITLTVCFVLTQQNKFLKILELYQLTANLSTVSSSKILPKEATLIAAGDVMLSRGVAVKIKENGPDYPFLKVQDYLKTGDIVFANLENPIAEGRTIKPGEMFFRADPNLVSELKDNNFSILSLANNHSGNFGTDGLKQTFQYLNEAGIKYVGAGENYEVANSPVFLKKNGLTFAFLAYDDINFTPAEYGAEEGKAGIAFFDQTEMSKAVALAKKQADFVIISMHFGNEYQPLPSTQQKEWAHLAIDLGADLVLGHHPHVVMPIEEYKGKYIFYSLGNFIFDQMWSRSTREGIIAKIIFNEKGEIKIQEVKPFLINDYCQPNFINGEEGAEILARAAWPLKSENGD